MPNITWTKHPAGRYVDTFVGRDDAGTMYFYVEVGDDNSMNGRLDAPARLRSPEDVQTLINILTSVVEGWPTA